MANATRSAQSRNIKNNYLPVIPGGGNLFFQLETRKNR